MARTYGTIQDGITYSTGTVTLSDFGQVIHDHNTTLTTISGTAHSAAFIKCLKLIKDSMESAGLSASIKIFVNGYIDELNFPCLCWTMGGNEFLFAVYPYDAYANCDQVLLAFRENSNTLTMRPTLPSGIGYYPYSTPVDNADCVYYLDTIRSDWYVRNFIFYDAFQSSQLASSFQVVYDDRGHIVILGKNSGNYSDDRDKTCFVFGKIGESNEFSDVVAINQSIYFRRYRRNSCMCAWMFIKYAKFKYRRYCFSCLHHTSARRQLWIQPKRPVRCLVCFY